MGILLDWLESLLYTTTSCSGTPKTMLPIITAQKKNSEAEKPRGYVPLSCISYEARHTNSFMGKCDISAFHPMLSGDGILELNNPNFRAKPQD